MLALLIGIFAAIIAAVSHALLARHLHKRWRLVSVPAFGVAAFAVCYIATVAWNHTLSAEDWLLAFVVALSLNIADTLLLIGVFYDSPTLALINAVADFEPGGMPVDLLPAFSARHPLTNSRLSALVEDGVVTDEGGSITVGGNVGLMLRLSETYRRLCRRELALG